MPEAQNAVSSLQMNPLPHKSHPIAILYRVHKYFIPFISFCFVGLFFFDIKEGLCFCLTRWGTKLCCNFDQVVSCLKD